MRWEKGRRGGNIDDRRGRIHTPEERQYMAMTARRDAEAARIRRMRDATQSNPVGVGSTVGARSRSMSPARQGRRPGRTATMGRR